MEKANKIVRIGNSSGFWGDEPEALKRQLRAGNLDYITADYLAEVSMSILRKQQNKNPEAGYVADFIDHILLAIDEIKSSSTKIITNAGGSNPVACAVRLAKELKANGISRKIIAIEGDNIVDSIDKLLKDGESFENFENKQPFKEIKDKVVAANVYISSEPIVKALEAGADIIIAGRASDSALTIGPLVYEFNWWLDDWDRLAAGMIAGHVIECGAQATGGNFTDWKTVENWKDMAFPIIEVHADGTFYVTKNKDDGGIVNEFTVKEQLVYEIGDPSYYYGPDVIADMTSITVEEVRHNIVRVSGAKGKPAPDTWKVSMAYSYGYKSSGSIIISAPDAVAKAEKFKEIFWRRLGYKFEKTATNLIGYNAAHLKVAQDIEPNEIMLQFTAFDHDTTKLDKFTRQLSGLILSGPPGVAATGGRPKLQEVIRYWPALINKKHLSFKLTEIDEEANPLVINTFMLSESEHSSSATIKPLEISIQEKPGFMLSANKKWVKMSQLCFARSGDKGDMVNIGVLARDERIYEFLKSELTADRIKHLFSSLCKGEVKRYQLDNMYGLNFTLGQALDGGGTYSGRIDPQGKTFASALLSKTIEVPEDLLSDL